MVFIFESKEIYHRRKFITAYTKRKINERKQILLFSFEFVTIACAEENLYIQENNNHKKPKVKTIGTNFFNRVKYQELT
jgi:hypothetical protein